jgi:hypothetical protein
MPRHTPFAFATAGTRPPSPANRPGLDYAVEAARLHEPRRPIYDFHAHTGGARAALVWARAADLFGVGRVNTMVRLSEAPAVREALGARAHFIAFPDFRADRAKAMREGFLADIAAFHERLGSRIVKLWNAPRMREFFPGGTGEDVVEFDSAWRVRHAELAASLGMAIMVHVADPDTWFATRYADAARFGRKIDHYRGLRVLMDRVHVPFIAAHMGGWPEDLSMLSTLLAAHPNLHLDTSATKWMVRELSRHPTGEVVAFLERWRGRILFGSDIVSTDEHLAPKPAPAAHPMGDLASSPEQALELYASRYLALRLMWETDYDGESPIADPDLAMVDPGAHGPMSAPRLRGLALPGDLLDELYFGAAERLMASLGA